MMNYRFLTRASDGSITLASKHPTGSPTWHWAASIKRTTMRGLVSRAERRTHQWHDYYRLLFGWVLIVSRQDYHLPHQAGRP